MRSTWGHVSTSKELLVISKFEKAGDLGISDYWVVPKISRCCVVNVFINCPFSDIWKRTSKYFEVGFAITLVNICLEVFDGAFVWGLHHRMPPIFV